MHVEDAALAKEHSRETLRVWRHGRKWEGLMGMALVQRKKNIPNKATREVNLRLPEVFHAPFGF